jgi:alkanesulfonate monooxygenase SsuD/methylene tetrahydromethanopterin reductase-like flavin-dependent oxidoreductase (luciferase family)
MAIRMALQIPNFTYPDTPPSALFERIAGVARAGEAAGFDAVFVMDHFYQLPMLGPTHHEMLEAYPLLGALAVSTSRVRLGTLVAGNTYRNPAHFAKIVTTLDVVSRGRAILGSARAGSSRSTRATASTSRRSASGCPGSTRRSRSSARCCAARSRRSRAATTARRRR